MMVVVAREKARSISWKIITLRLANLESEAERMGTAVVAAGYEDGKYTEVLWVNWWIEMKWVLELRAHGTPIKAMKT